MNIEYVERRAISEPSINLNLSTVRKPNQLMAFTSEGLKYVEPQNRKWVSLVELSDSQITLI